jgi:hypothetical protein
MKKGRNHGWTLMDADIPVARHRFLSIRVYPRPSAVRIFGSDYRRFSWRCSMAAGRESRAALQAAALFAS